LPNSPLGKDAPEPRAIHPPEMGSVVALPLVGGLYHRYGLPERARIKPCRYWLSDFLVRRVLAHKCASQRIWFPRFKQGPQAHRLLRFVWKNNFDPWAALNFREAQFQQTQFRIGDETVVSVRMPKRSLLLFGEKRPVRISVGRRADDTSNSDRAGFSPFARGMSRCYSNPRTSVWRDFEVVGRRRDRDPRWAEPLMGRAS